MILISKAKCLLLSCFAITQLFVCAHAAESYRVELQTTMGVIELQLFEEKAPKTVKNFLDYVKSGYYDGMIFHRVVEGWIIQGGGYDKDLNEYETHGPIRNEATNGLKNVRGTVAMARFWDPHSAETQFFINLSDNPSFDHQSRTLREYGYCVFARVVKGMDIADAIGKVETREITDFDANVPVELVIITRARVLAE